MGEASFGTSPEDSHLTAPGCTVQGNREAHGGVTPETDRLFQRYVAIDTSASALAHAKHFGRARKSLIDLRSGGEVRFAKSALPRPESEDGFGGTPANRPEFAARCLPLTLRDAVCSL
jgi:hypothetical protein